MSDTSTASNVRTVEPQDLLCIPSFRRNFLELSHISISGSYILAPEQHIVYYDIRILWLLWRQNLCWSRLLTPSLCPPPAFQVDSRDERQRYAIKNLPGRHLWRRHELAIATGFVDESEKLTTRLTHLFGRNWKEYYMYLVLFFSLVSVGNKWADEWNGRVNALVNKIIIF